MHLLWTYLRPHWRLALLALLLATASQVLALVDPKTRPCLNAIIGVYERLLDKLEAEDFAVFGERVRLSKWQKLGVMASSYIRR